MFFTFPEDARWNAERQAVEFGVEIGEYQGVVRVPRRVFQRLLPQRPTPERWNDRFILEPSRDRLPDPVPYPDVLRRTPPTPPQAQRAHWPRAAPALLTSARVLRCACSRQ